MTRFRYISVIFLAVMFASCVKENFAFDQDEYKERSTQICHDDAHGDLVGGEEGSGQGVAQADKTGSV